MKSASDMSPDEKSEALLEMRQWIRGRFTPLQEFASRSEHSASGYDHNEVQLFDHLRYEFDGKYPESLIEHAAETMRENNGPWGDESEFHRDESPPTNYI